MFSEKLEKLVAERFPQLTEIQTKAIPIISSGKNVLVLAPTGFGKTESALLPLFEQLLKRRETGDELKGIQILYIAPLRALSRDLVERMQWWAERLDLTLAMRHGDTTQNERQKQAKVWPQMLVTTPETFNALLIHPRMRASLENVKAVIIDEVHELYAEKRGAQLSIALERLLEIRQHEPFQRIGLSATVGNAEAVAKFLCGDRPCETVALGIERKIELHVESPKPNEEIKKLAELLKTDADAAARLHRLDQLIHEHEATLAFVNTRSIAEILTNRLLKWREFKEGAAIAVHHGSLSKEVRVKAEERFKGRELRGLIATSSLELGIDIGQIDLVVQYGSPRQVARLIQRVGRSGHAVRRIPKGIIIASDADDVAEAGAIVALAHEGFIETEPIPENALDVVSNQLTGLTLDKSGITLAAALPIIQRAYPFRNLSAEQLTNIANQLNQERQAIFDGVTLTPTARTKLFYYERLSMISDERKFLIRNSVTNKPIGSLDETFVAEYLAVGETFITKGLPWRVLDMDEEEVIVEPADSTEAAIPDWIGEEIPVPYEVAQRVGRLRRELAGEHEADKLRHTYRLSANAYEKLHELVEKQKATGFLPTDQNISVELLHEMAVIHICCGTRINETLALALNAQLSELWGLAVKSKVAPYRIILPCPEGKARDVEVVLRNLTPEKLKSLLAQVLPKTTLFRYDFIHIAKAFGLLDKKADYRHINVRRLMETMKESPIYSEAIRHSLTARLDLPTAQKQLEQIRQNKIHLSSFSLQAASPLTLVAYQRQLASEWLAPLPSAGEVLKAYYENLLEQDARFFCTYCHALSYSKVKELKKKFSCSSCGSDLLAMVPENVDAVDTYMRKVKQGKKLSTTDQKVERRVKIVSSMMHAYGRRAAIALTAYGVGPRTASRILSRVHPDELKLAADLMDATKNFIRTRRFWAA